MLDVIFTKIAAKQIKKAPKHVQVKLRKWILSVTSVGLEETRKIPGYHDEPIHKGLERRSIRLNNQWRAEYRLEKDEVGKIVLILEVHPHDY
jgi:proteic killer suppression protein